MTTDFKLHKSEEIKELAAALCQVQLEIEHAKKSQENPYFKSSYADLADICTVTKKVLPKHGLCYTQLVTGETGKYSLVTMLIHTSGQWLAGDYPLVPTKNDPQSLGSAVTYARRYSLQAIVGMASEDDDGNSASEPNIQSIQKLKQGTDHDFQPNEYLEDKSAEFEAMTGQKARSEIQVCDCGNNMMRSLYPEHLPKEQRGWYCGKCKQQRAADGTKIPKK